MSRQHENARDPKVQLEVSPLVAAEAHLKRQKKRAAILRSRVTTFSNRLLRLEYIKATDPHSEEALWNAHSVNLQNIRDGIALYTAQVECAVRAVTKAEAEVARLTAEQRAIENRCRDRTTDATT